MVAKISIGMEKMHKSMSLYVKHVGKKSEGEERDKVPIGYLGSTMVSHGQDFSPDSEFGNCLTRTSGNALVMITVQNNANCLCRVWSRERSPCTTPRSVCWI